MYLLPEFWGKGLGSELLTCATENLKKYYEVILLWVLKSNLKAISFYEGQGFIQEGFERQENVWDAYVHEIRMSKAITSR